tara:strand:- start:1209 stop:1505 length:297 start_codon:yes stop_codon:yes gene_type:complete
MFENILGTITENSTLLAGGGASAVALWVLKKIPNDKICGVIESGMESIGRLLTLNLSKWSMTKNIWNNTIEPYFVDLIDNVFGSLVRGFIKGLRSDNK